MRVAAIIAVAIVLAAYFLAQWSPLEGSTIILSNNTVKAIEVKQ